jgi:hypothetical protein
MHIDMNIFMNIFLPLGSAAAEYDIYSVSGSNNTADKFNGNKQVCFVLLYVLINTSKLFFMYLQTIFYQVIIWTYELI